MLAFFLFVSREWKNEKKSKKNLSQFISSLTFHMRMGAAHWLPAAQSHHFAQFPTVFENSIESRKKIERNLRISNYGN